MKFEQHRQMAELALVGSCIWEDRYKEVSFLTPKNFHKWGQFDLPFIWGCLPGDIHLVSRNAKLKGRDLALEITELTNYSVYTHITPIALGLMEDEFRRGFLETLERICVRVTNNTYKAAIMEVRVSIPDESIDVFEVISAGISYLNKFEHPPMDKTLAEFKARLESKIKEIKAVTNGI